MSKATVVSLFPLILMLIHGVQGDDPRSLFHRTSLASTAVLSYRTGKNDGWKEASYTMDIATDIGFAIPFVPTEGTAGWKTQVVDLLDDHFGMTTASHPGQVPFILEKAIKIAQKLNSGCRAMGNTDWGKCRRAFTRVGQLQGNKTTVGQQFTVTTEPTTSSSGQITPATPSEPDPLG